MSDICSNRNSKKKRSIIVLVSSVFFHGILLFFTMEHEQFKKNISKKRKRDVIRISLKKKKPKSRPKFNKKKMQIVETQERKEKKISKDAKFLSRNNQSFEREVVAKSVGSHKRAGQGSRNGKKTQRQSKNIKEKTVAIKVIKNPKKKKKKKKGKTITLADLAFKPLKKNEKKPRPQEFAAKGLKSGAKGQSGLAQNNDFVEDIPLGDMTNLNTVEFKYFGFYNRIKKQLEKHWGSSIKQKVSRLQNSGRRLASKSNYITSLVITLDGRGSIQSISVKGSSGVNDLDSAAVESFNKAGPFPNPPRGMIKNGIATIEWGFAVKS